MANYPVSLDTITNPTSGNTLDNPSHSLQHSDANDILEALEQKVGIGSSVAGSATAGHALVASTGGTTSWTTIGTAGISSGAATSGQILTANGSGGVSFTENSGLVLLNTTTFSAQSSVSVNNVFTSSYANYFLMINPTAFSATNSAINIRLRVGGVDASGADYNSERQRNENSAITATRFASQTAFQVGAFNTTGPTRNIKEMHIYSPQEAVTTSFWTIGNYVDNAGSLKTEMNGGYHALSTSYDGFTLTLDSGTISGTLRVYGLRN